MSCGEEIFGEKDEKTEDKGEAEEVKEEEAKEQEEAEDAKTEEVKEEARSRQPGSMPGWTPWEA